MKQFKITFNFQTDDNWVNGDVKEMIEKVIDPIYHLGDTSVGEISIEETEVQE